MKKQLKPLFGMFLTVFMMILLTGCGGEPPAAATESSQDSSSSTVTEQEDTSGSADDSRNASEQEQPEATDTLLNCMEAIPEVGETQNPVRVALIDSGISTQVISKDRIETGWNYITASTDTEDTYNHGTGSAYIIQTIAPHVELCPLVCTHYDTGKVENVSADTVAQMVTDAVERYHCKVVCVELGIDKKNKALEEAVRQAEKSGVVVVAPVGNGYSERTTTYYPAAYDTVIGVGSVDVETGAPADFSQRGKAVKLVGPQAAATKTVTGQDVMDAGTSISTAYVTGCVVRLLEQEPDLSPDEVRQKLYTTAVDLGKEGYDTDTGWGFANLAAALSSSAQ